MSNNDENFSTPTDLVKQQNNKFSLSKYEADLYDDKCNVPYKVIQVKRIASGDNEIWKILNNNEVIFTIDGEKISKKEKEFLRTANGVMYLINEFKISTFKSLNSFKKKLKEKMRS